MLTTHPGSANLAGDKKSAFSRVTLASENIIKFALNNQFISTPYIDPMFVFVKYHTEVGHLLPGLHKKWGTFDRFTE